MKFWRITDRGDPHVRSLIDGLIDGEVHYSRQTWGATGFVRNGQSLVLIAYNGAAPVATWISHRPTPGKAVRQDGRDAIECTLFKLIRGHGLRKLTGGKLRASDLIREATDFTYAAWGCPSDGLITFVRPEKTERFRDEEHDPGWCYIMAGWIDTCKPSSDGKPCLRAPMLDTVSDIREWKWSGSRGGKLRFEIGELRGSCGTSGDFAIPR